MYIYFVTADKTNAEMYAAGAHILPHDWQWPNIINIWSAAPVFRHFLNSLIVAGGGTAIAIICGIPACRMRFRGKSVFMGAVIMSRMFCWSLSSSSTATT